MCQRSHRQSLCCVSKREDLGRPQMSKLWCYCGWMGFGPAACARVSCACLRHRQQGGAWGWPGLKFKTFPSQSVNQVAPGPIFGSEAKA